MSRILLVTNIFPPMIGGPAIFIDRLASQLAKRGHHVTVVCSTESRPASDYDAARPFKVCRVNVSSRYVYEVMVRLVLLWQLLLHKNILVNGLENYIAPIARLLRRTYVLKVVGDSVWEQGRNWGVVTSGFNHFQAEPVPPKLFSLSRARKQWVDLARIVVTPGAYLKEIVVGWGIASDKVRIIRNGVPLEIFSGYRPAARDGDLNIVFVGRLTNWKGVETLMLAMQKVVGAHLTIIGDGPELPMLYTLCQQLALGHKVSFWGKMEQNKLHQHLAEMHVLALPSGYEGLSHTLLEAGAAGLARLASNIGGNADVITNEVDGLLLPYGDVAAWQGAIERLVQDDALRLKLATAGQQAVTRDNFADGARAYIELIEGKL